MTFKEGWDIFWNAQPANFAKINETNKEYLTKPAHEVGIDTPNSAASVPEHSIDNQSFYNNDWLDQQAQRMMDFQTSANKAAMDFESAEADKARAWNLEMANTAMQRRVEDLKKAGLNPALAYQLGGADVPSVNGASGFSSAGAMVSTMDQGYTKYQLDYAYTKMLVNAATDLVKVLASFVK